jgi:hypothetical protein
MIETRTSPSCETTSADAIANRDRGDLSEPALRHFRRQ